MLIALINLVVSKSLNGVIFETPALKQVKSLLLRLKLVSILLTSMTSGLYPFPENGPQIPGGEAAGVIKAVGDGVTNLGIGDRVAYSTPNGAYREERLYLQTVW